MKSAVGTAGMLIAFSVLWVGCTGVTEESFMEEAGLPFDWIELGRQLVYNFHPVSDTLADGQTGFRYDDTEEALIVRVEGDNSTSVVELVLRFPKWPRLPSPLALGLSSLDVERSPEGLIDAAPESCAPGSWFKSYFSFVRVPANATLGEHYPQYACKDRIRDVYRVVAVSHRITVDAGTFGDVVVLESRDYRKKEYWSTSGGLVKIEVFTDEGALLGYYELSSKDP